MSQTGSYVTSLVWETTDAEGPTRAEYQTNWNAMDGHSHDNRGAGRGIRTIQTTSAPTQTGDIQINGDALQWWGATSTAVITAVNPNTAVSSLLFSGPAGVATTRFVGIVSASGAPTGGSWLQWDFGYDEAGNAWLCTVAGSPGTWIAVGYGGGIISKTLITVSGNYTIPAHTRSLLVECLGGGGGSGGVATGGSSTYGCSAGGGGGGFGSSRITNLPASPVAVVIGAGGTGGAAGLNDGGDGGNTSFNGTTVIGTGGGHSAGVQAISPQSATSGGLGGSATGDIVVGGAGGQGAWSIASSSISSSGNGGDGAGPYGGGGGRGDTTGNASQSIPGNPGSNYGAGAGGANSTGTAGNAAGAAGAQGVCVVTAFY